MLFLLRILLSLSINACALFVAGSFIPGFTVQRSFSGIGAAALILTILHIFVRPILKIFLTPFIFLTLGLGSLVLHALILVMLDYFSQSIRITTFTALFEGIILISLTAFALHLVFDHFFKREH